ASTIPCCGGGSWVPAGTTRPELRMRSWSTSLTTIWSNSGRNWWRTVSTGSGRDCVLIARIFAHSARRAGSGEAGDRPHRAQPRVIVRGGDDQLAAELIEAAERDRVALGRRDRSGRQEVTIGAMGDAGE